MCAYVSTGLLLFSLSEFITSNHGGCYSHSRCCCHGAGLFSSADPSAFQHWPLTSPQPSNRQPLKDLHTESVCVFSRFPRLLQLLHRRGVSGGPRAARDGAELCFCFWHGGQEANEEVVSYTDYELQQPTGGWDPLLWPAHLHQAPRPRQRAVLRPRALQCHG